MMMVMTITIMSSLSLQLAYPPFKTTILYYSISHHHNHHHHHHYIYVGKRVNTREVRMRESYTKERIQIIEELLKLNPTFQAPVDFIKSKPVRRIYIPKQLNPMYNYIGLIIGPRGNTQKQLEQQTNTKISIRGRGN